MKRLTAKDLLKEVLSIKKLSSSAVQRQLTRLLEVADALSTLQHRADSLEGREVDALQNSLEEYSTHLYAEIKRLKGSGNAKKFLAMVEKKVEDLASKYARNKKPKLNRYIEAENFRLVDMDTGSPRVEFDYSIIKASSGRIYNLERDAEYWRNTFSYHLIDWAANYGIHSGYVWNKVHNKKEGTISIYIPDEYK